jgi:hypothetical protein
MMATAVIIPQTLGQPSVAAFQPGIGTQSPFQETFTITGLGSINDINWVDSISITEMSFNGEPSFPINEVDFQNPPVPLLAGGLATAAFTGPPETQWTLTYELLAGYSWLPEGLVTVRIDDGVAPAVHQQVLRPPTLQTVTGQIYVADLIKPFPPELYGFHKLILNAWRVDPSGAPLPPEDQATSPDDRLFTLQSSTWVYVCIKPDCQSQGGPEGWRILSFNVSPTQVQLDSSGTKVAPNQIVTVTWDVETANLPATQYGYPGSFAGVYFYTENLYRSLAVLPGAGKTGQAQLDLSGTYYSPGFSVGIGTGQNGCLSSDSEADHVVLVGVIAQPPFPPSPTAQLAFAGEQYTPTSTSFTDEDFSMDFIAINIGSKNSGPFVAHMELDPGLEGEETMDRDVTDLAPNATYTASWDFPAYYLAAGQHWVYCYLIQNQVKVAQTSVGIILSDRP